ncbi:hypothetical protein K504DRAFT_465258 [Pleomassaria siparia CBS 279.74]|uniref:Uncharacterized protein n=1 Tax=Pleomassaria siparia CBS 279.74 TaxID=1314801 RepID=A0A6G1KFF4_9PLEO|nr:hypothetical protein K504DRAFT_465258 [Pleomassaria siparia CBS 279.74]
MRHIIHLHGVWQGTKGWLDINVSGLADGRLCRSHASIYRGNAPRIAQIISRWNTHKVDKATRYSGHVYWSELNICCRETSSLESSVLVAIAGVLFPLFTAVRLTLLHLSSTNNTTTAFGRFPPRHARSKRKQFHLGRASLIKGM